MTSGGVEISTDSLREASRGLSQICERMGTELDQLGNKLEQYAGCWGTDQFGQLIGEAIQEVVAFMFDMLRQWAEDQCERATDLNGMADWYDQAEQRFVDAFKQLSEQLGNVPDFMQGR
jgi:hypothetical protein